MRIYEILNYLRETGSECTARRIKRKIEEIPATESINAVDYGRELSHLKKHGLVQNSNTQKSKWRITERGKKLISGEMDISHL